MKKPKLPEGYEAVGSAEVSGQEIVDLNEISVVYPPGIYGRTAAHWEKTIESALGVVGVRSQDGLLVAVGFLEQDNNGESRLESLVVHPEHRHRGIGKFLIDSRIRQAHKLGIKHLQSSLDTTNTLASYYGERGVFTYESGL